MLTRIDQLPETVAGMGGCLRSGNLPTMHMAAIRKHEEVCPGFHITGKQTPRGLAEVCTECGGVIKRY